MADLDEKIETYAQTHHDSHAVADLMHALAALCHQTGTDPQALEELHQAGITSEDLASLHTSDSPDADTLVLSVIVDGDRGVPPERAVRARYLHLNDVADVCNVTEEALDALRRGVPYSDTPGESETLYLIPTEAGALSGVLASLRNGEHTVALDAATAPLCIGAQEKLAARASDADPQSAIAELLTLAHQREVGEGDLDEHVHDVASRVGSGVNNGGLERQVAYLHGALGSAETRRILETELAGD